MGDVEQLAIKAIDKGSKALLDRGRGRGHLGASTIGQRCLRQSWYGFRKVYVEQHTARILRLFDRGNDEELRVIRWMRAGGFRVREYSQRLVLYPASHTYALTDWDDPVPAGAQDVSIYHEHHLVAKEHGVEARQWGFTDYGDHHGGSCDGKVMFPDDIPGAPSGWGLQEFKTHNEKSFADLVKKGVVTSKLQHAVQMQVYMHRLELAWGLYIAVNKNTDEIYVEIIRARPELAAQYADRAKKIIEAVEAPARLTNDPAWFECKFCAFREICHKGEAPQKNCRSCAFARADTTAPGATWYCTLHRGHIPYDFQPKGCDQWQGVK